MSALTTFLRCCTVLYVDAGAIERLRRAAAGVADWEPLAEVAERHGLAPLVYQHCKTAGLTLPAMQTTQLRALTLRHRNAAATRRDVLSEILGALEREHIQVLLLKGAALAHMVYPAPALRPMRDVDLLVSPAHAGSAQQVLRELGFSAPDQHGGFMHDHHHLPGASRQQNGLMISVEIHHDALSGDVPASIRTDNLTAPVQKFQLGDRTARALGHVDMLRHLCHHTFEPIAEIKLGSVVDLVAYADRFREDIDWGSVNREFPFILNSLHCLHYIAPLPTALVAKIGRPETPAPRGLGVGLKPISQILRRGASPGRAARELLDPSDWWLHAYYNVEPGRSLTTTRWLRHPARVGHWLWRRLRAHRHSRHETGAIR